MKAKHTRNHADPFDQSLADHNFARATKGHGPSSIDARFTGTCATAGIHKRGMYVHLHTCMLQNYLWLGDPSSLSRFPKPGVLC